MYIFFRKFIRLLIIDVFVFHIFAYIWRIPKVSPLFKNVFKHISFFIFFISYKQRSGTFWYSISVVEYNWFRQRNYAQSVLIIYNFVKNIRVFRRALLEETAFMALNIGSQKSIQRRKTFNDGKNNKLHVEIFCEYLTCFQQFLQLREFFPHLK